MTMTMTLSDLRQLTGTYTRGETGIVQYDDTTIQQ